MEGFTDKYPLLFYSIVFQCFVYGIYLVFYINDKILNIDRSFAIKSRGAREIEKSEIELSTKKNKDKLKTQSKKHMLFLLVIILMFNSVYIINRGIVDIPGLIGGLLFPILSYLLFVFFLLIVLGLKGANILRTGRFFKGIDI